MIFCRILWFIFCPRIRAAKYGDKAFILWLEGRGWTKGKDHIVLSEQEFYATAWSIVLTDPHTQPLRVRGKAYAASYYELEIPAGSTYGAHKFFYDIVTGVQPVPENSAS